MSEHSERTSAEDVLQTSELAARLLRRLTTSPGVIDTQRLFRTYARLTEVITHAHPLLHDLLARYFIANDSTLQNLPLVMDQPWMLNLNTYLTNNSSVSSTSTTNNSYFTSTAINQSILQSTNSLTTNTNLFGAASQPAPPEKFRISRRASDRRESVSIDVQGDVLNPIAQQRAEPATQSLAHLEEQPLTLANREHRIGEPARPAPSAVPTLINPTHVQPPLAPPVIQRELLDSEIKTTRLVLHDNERIKIERHSTKSEERHETNTSQTRFAVTEVRAAAIPTTLPLAQEQIPASQFQARPQQLIWRKSADTQTLRDLVADVSSSSSLAAVRQAIDSLPVAQTPSSAPMMSPESTFREVESPKSEEITTEGMLRRISKMLLIERERRGY
jgi:hypothetical protein